MLKRIAFLLAVAFVMGTPLADAATEFSPARDGGTIPESNPTGAQSVIENKEDVAELLVAPQAPKPSPDVDTPGGGNTVITEHVYDEEGNIIKTIITTYDEEGNMISRVVITGGKGSEESSAELE
jgi:hypothetical protein